MDGQKDKREKMEQKHMLRQRQEMREHEGAEKEPPWVPPAFPVSDP